MTDKPHSHQSQAEFEQALRDRLTGGQGKAPTTAHMTSAPTGKSGSLDQLLSKDGVSAIPALVHEASATVEPAGKLRKSGERVIVKLKLAQLVDSPYQPRLRYDETRLQQLAGQMEAHGQNEPVRVRLLPSRKYELIAGHRRKRAAGLLGWEEIDAVIEELDDRQAKIATLSSNESNEGLSDFERGLAYNSALEDGLASTQEQVAKLFGCTQGRVSQCLSVIRLPAPIVSLLQRYPDLLSYRHAKVLKEVLAVHPDKIDTIVREVETIIDEPDLEPEELRTRCLRADKVPVQRASPAKPKFVADQAGTAAFTVRSNSKQLVVSYHSSLKPEQLEVAEREVLETLRKLAGSYVTPS